MWHFLRSECHPETGNKLVGMRQDLAVALVSVFGGNVALVINAVESLKEWKVRAFHCLSNIEGARSVDSLLDDSAKDKATEDAVKRKSIDNEQSWLLQGSREGE
jgi:hypothetical protein